jgi:Domain of unknown function (DUF4345)
MRPFAIALRLLAIAFIATASLHLVYGLKADAMLGAQVSAEMVHNASLDSQNRFYGITFSMLGVALFVAATDLRQYRPIVVANLAVSFAAGLARIVSWALYGSPAPMIVGIVIADLLLPPIFYVWLRKAIPSNGS